ncbi:MAG: hypothetical protein II051_05385, partial [Lachnospiraceae bacterium]|nr:hypothetical protein [Lachnospiraceae bacterium]
MGTFNGLNDVKSAFEPKLYFGLGGAHTYALNPTADNAYFAKYGKFHPWQLTHDPNEVIGFRLGAIAQYNLPFGLGFYADLCGEAYIDVFAEYCYATLVFASLRHNEVSIAFCRFDELLVH